MFKFDWTAAAVAELQRLWNEGLSTKQIGYRIGCSKNAVIGKAHRLGLEPRPTPIAVGAKDGEPKPSKRVVPKVTLPPLPAVSVVAQLPIQSPVPVATLEHKPTPALAPKPATFARVRTCEWLDGERGNYTKCSKPAHQFKPYCAEHCARVYVPPRREAS